MNEGRRCVCGAPMQYCGQSKIEVFWICLFCGRLRRESKLQPYLLTYAFESSSPDAPPVITPAATAGEGE